MTSVNKKGKKKTYFLFLKNLKKLETIPTKTEPVL